MKRHATTLGWRRGRRSEVVADGGGDTAAAATADVQGATDVVLAPRRCYHLGRCSMPGGRRENKLT